MSRRDIYTPVALFTYNRLEHLRATYDALRNNTNATNTDLYIFSDGPRDNSHDIDAVRAVRDFIATIDGFNKITIKEEPSNKGLARSIVDGVSEILERHSSVIVFEDDLISAPSTLNYFNRTLEHYSSFCGVFSVSAYSPSPSLFRIPKDYNFDIYFIPRMQCWGWATWRDRWKLVDWEVSDFDAFVSSSSATDAYSHWIGADSLKTLTDCVRNARDVWACRWVYTHFKHHAVCACPTSSYIVNIGLDGSGANCGVSPIRPDILSEYPSEPMRFPENIFVDRRIFSYFMDASSFNTAAMYAQRLLQATRRVVKLPLNSIRNRL